MAQPVTITNIKDYITDIVGNHDMSLAPFLQKAKADNCKIIDALVKNYKVPLITLNTKGIKVINFKQLNCYYKHRYFLFEDAIGKVCLAVNNITAITVNGIKDLGNLEVYIVRDKEFDQILQRAFSKDNTIRAVTYLENNTRYCSSKSINYLKTIVGFLIIFFASIIYSIGSFNVANGVLYFAQNFLKILLFGRSMSSNITGLKSFSNKKLPIYSILIPLYKEETKAESILNAIEKLNYPKDRLDVKFLLEADDVMTARALSGLELPGYVQLIKVPYSLPRTKPKALNYAMPFVIGDYLTVYDAEDEPDPDQLIKAITAFEQLPEEYACVQAKLNFYNARENLLTRLFSIEYSVWFEYLLRGLSLFNLPMTLGGTSNHFKVDKLKEVGFWDAYNVTEDADLGIRLYLEGYKVCMIDSTTMEEAPSNLTDWLAQRARWIKGFIQTILVFMKTKKDRAKFGLIKTVSVYIFVGLSTYSFFFLPWLLLIFLVKLHPIIYYLWLLNSFFSVSYMYTVAYVVLASKKSPVNLEFLMDWVALLVWPIYFVLHTVASYRAIWETLTAPFKWNKTPHGMKVDDFS
ncbi:MAG: hypothetical protein Tsb006_7130 [Rickettsiaceae bacterium]